MDIQCGGSIPFSMVLNDAKTPATGKVPEVRMIKDGGTVQVPFGMVHELGLGFYAITGNNKDTDTPGTLCLSATHPDCVTSLLQFTILPQDNPRDMRKTEKLLGDIIEQNNRLFERNY
jgi:hypothetical protein